MAMGRPCADSHLGFVPLSLPSRAGVSQELETLLASRSVGWSVHGGICLQHSSSFGLAGVPGPSEPHGRICAGGNMHIPGVSGHAVGRS